MELSPGIYRRFVRPKWFTKVYINNIVSREFTFDNKTVLDFGCGVGSNFTIFDSSGYLGVDIDEDRIAYAKHLYPGGRFSRIEGSMLPARSGTYDFIFICSVLHHISDEELAKFIKEFYRVLKSGGKIIVIEPCYFEGCHISRLFMSTFDKGKYIRNEDEYINIFDKEYFGTRIMKVFNELFFYRKLFFLVSKK